MPKTRENFIHLYWDKALLLLLAAVGIYVFLGRVFSSPIQIGGPALGPQQLVDELVRETDTLEGRLGQYSAAEYPAPQYLQQIEERFGPSASAGAGNAWVMPLPAEGARAGRVQIPTPNVLEPLSLQAQSGIGSIATNSPARRGGSTRAASSESGKGIYWVTVAAEFPFRKQLLAFAGLEPLTDKDQYPLFARLDLERQELLPDGSWSPAESVNPYELYRQDFAETVKNLAELYSLSSDEEQLVNVNALRSWLGRKGFQEFIVRPEFSSLDGFEQWYWPEESANLTDNQVRSQTLAGPPPARDDSPRYRAVDRSGRQATGTQAGRAPVVRAPGPMTGSPVSVLGPGGPGIGAFELPRMESPVGRRSGSTASGRGGSERRIEIPRDVRLEDAPEIVGIWAHDISAKPGCTYRYRMRVLLFNPLCGDERAENKKTRQQAWLTGAWSDWSEPVETLQSRYLFFTGVAPGIGSKPPRIRAEIYAWQQGWWYSSMFYYSDAGQEIGSPRAVPQFVLAGDARPVRRAEASLGVGASGRDRTMPAGSGPRPRITVDFTTDWTIVDFSTEVQRDQPADNASAPVKPVTTSELVVMEKSTGNLAYRYSVMDSEDPRRQRLEELIDRQDKAFKEMDRRPDQRDRAPTDPRSRPGSSRGGGVGSPGPGPIRGF